jgi:hypothetical protein
VQDQCRAAGAESKAAGSSALLAGVRMWRLDPWRNNLRQHQHDGRYYAEFVFGRGANEARKRSGGSATALPQPQIGHVSRQHGIVEKRRMQGGC